MTQPTTRRAVLGALAGAPVALIAIGPSEAAVPPADRIAWDRAVARFEAAERAAQAAFNREEQASIRYHDLRPTDEDFCRAIDWRVLFPIGGSETRRLQAVLTHDVDEDWHWFLSQEQVTWWTPDPEAFKAKRRAALDGLLAMRQRDKDAREQSGLTKASDEAEALDERRYELDWALIEMPAPDHAALMWKVEHLLRDERDTLTGCPAAREAFIADCRRLLGREG